MGIVSKPDHVDGVGLIRLERSRQIIECTWDDKRHKPGVLSEMAMFVLRPGLGNLDPWQIKTKHPDRMEQLIIAGALIAAEIDRMRCESRLPDISEAVLPSTPDRCCGCDRPLDQSGSCQVCMAEAIDCRD